MAEIMKMLVFLSAAAVSGWLLERQMKKRWGRRPGPIRAAVPVASCAVLILTFGVTAAAVQGFILALLLLYASESDLQTREVDDSIHLMVVLTALMNVSLSDISFMLLSAVIITLPQLAIAVCRPNTYGGADIKLMAACAFLLGLRRGLAAIITGLTLAVLLTAISRKIRKQELNKPIALVPYLSLGCFLAFIL